MNTARLAAALDTLRAARALVRTAVLFHIGGRQAVAHATRTAMAMTPASPGSLRSGGAEVWRAFRAVRRVKRLWPGEVLCLQTAMMLQDVLARRGIDAAIRVGVRMNKGDVAAHAWVEVAGWSIDDARGHEAFSVLHLEQMREGQVTV
jgi:hypothetical protein